MGMDARGRAAPGRRRGRSPPQGAGCFSSARCSARFRPPLRPNRRSRRPPRETSPGDICELRHGAATQCDLARQLQAKIGRARDQLLTFCDYPGEVDATNNGSERRLRPCVIQRKVTNGYRAMWAARAEADVRTTVDTRIGFGRDSVLTNPNGPPTLTHYESQQFRSANTQHAAESNPQAIGRARGN